MHNFQKWVGQHLRIRVVDILQMKFLYRLRNEGYAIQIWDMFLWGLQSIRKICTDNEEKHKFPHK